MPVLRNSSPDSPPAKNTPAARLALVDDDQFFREALENNLRDNGYDTCSFPGGKEFFDYVEAKDTAPFDLLLLDWKMPGMTGIELLREARTRDIPIPALFLTALSDQIYEEEALTLGAVDFIDKSRSLSIILKRIRLRLMGENDTAPSQTSSGTRPSTTAPFRLGSLTLYEKESRAAWKDKEVPLTLAEFRVVRYLAGRRGKDVRYRELYDQVHGPGFAAGYGEDGYKANTRTFIKRIRKKFRALDDGFNAIENYPGFGYRWHERA